MALEQRMLGITKKLQCKPRSVHFGPCRIGAKTPQGISPNLNRLRVYMLSFVPEGVHPRELWFHSSELNLRGMLRSSRRLPSC